jgi:hypothetical protein
MEEEEEVVTTTISCLKDMETPSNCSLHLLRCVFVCI